MNRNWKLRWAMIKEAMTSGKEEYDMLRMNDYRNWSPLSLYCYQVGVFGGCLASMISIVIILVCLYILGVRIVL